MKNATIFAALLLLGLNCVEAKRVKTDLSIVNVPEEGGVSFERITEDSDCVFANWPRETKWGLGKAKIATVSWWVNPIIAVSPDGKKIGYLNFKNQTSNIMIKNASKGGASTQRTFRTKVQDFTWSPDGKTLCFTEFRSGHNGVYLVEADQGSIVRQISNSGDNDYAGQISDDGNLIFFHRGEGMYAYSLWSFDRQTNLFSNYSRGMTPVLLPNQKDVLYCSRFTDRKESEIWRVNTTTGVEEIILSQPGRSFTTPQLSPDGEWLLVTGTSIDEKGKNFNTDIFAIKADGSHFTQLTYHPGNDLSAVWAPNGKSIYFVSQRGSKEGLYNVWKMDFNL